MKGYGLYLRHSKKIKKQASSSVRLGEQVDYIGALKVLFGMVQIFHVLVVVWSHDCIIFQNSSSCTTKKYDFYYI